MNKISKKDKALKGLRWELRGMLLPHSRLDFFLCISTLSQVLSLLYIFSLTCCLYSFVYGFWGESHENDLPAPLVLCLTSDCVLLFSPQTCYSLSLWLTFSAACSAIIFSLSWNVNILSIQGFSALHSLLIRTWSFVKVLLDCTYFGVKKDSLVVPVYKSLCNKSVSPLILHEDLAKMSGSSDNLFEVEFTCILLVQPSSLAHSECVVSIWLGWLSTSWAVPHRFPLGHLLLLCKAHYLVSYMAWMHVMQKM